MQDFIEQPKTSAFVAGAEPPPRIRTCRACGGAMLFVTKIMRVSEPGHMRMFECVECKKLDFIPEPHQPPGR
jgi:hypothetical protein